MSQQRALVAKKANDSGAAFGWMRPPPLRPLPLNTGQRRDSNPRPRLALPPTCTAPRSPRRGLTRRLRGANRKCRSAPAGSMAAARCLRLCGRWRPALLGPARRRLPAAASFVSPGAPPGPAPPPRAAFSTAPRWRRWSSGGLAGGDGLEGGGGGEEGGGGADPGGSAPVMTALTPLMVPEHFPNVPLIAVTRNPVFPRFIKIIEVGGGCGGGPMCPGRLPAALPFRGVGVGPARPPALSSGAVWGGGAARGTALLAAPSVHGGGRGSRALHCRCLSVCGREFVLRKALSLPAFVTELLQAGRRLCVVDP